MAQRVLRDSTATLETYPPVLAQATGTPTARIRTPAFAMPDVGATATVDSLSTDVSGDAAAGRVEIAVTTATWVRGRRYVATSTTSDVFPILSASSGPADTLYLQEPLTTALLTGSAIKGYRLSIALTSAQTAQLSDQCVVEWTAILDGVERTWAEDFAVVERDGVYTLDSVRLTQSSPFCRRMQSDADPDFNEMIGAAWRRYVEPALRAKGIRPQLWISRSELEAAHIAACEYLATQDMDDAAMRAEKRAEFTAALTLVLASETLWIDDTAQALTPPDPAAPRAWSRTDLVR